MGGDKARWIEQDFTQMLVGCGRLDKEKRHYS